MNRTKHFLQFLNLDATFSENILQIDDYVKFGQSLKKVEKEVKKKIINKVLGSK
jgi:hypothetical protein